MPLFSLDKNVRGGGIIFVYFIWEDFFSMKKTQLYFALTLFTAFSALQLTSCGKKEGKECYRLTELGAKFANAAIENKKAQKAYYKEKGIIPIRYLDDTTTEPVKEGEIVEGEAKFIIPFSNYEGNASNLFLLGTRSGGDLKKADDPNDIGGLIYPSTTLSKEELTSYRLKTNPEGEWTEKYTIQPDIFNEEQQLEVEYTLTSTDGTFKPTQGVIIDYDVTLINDHEPERKTEDPDMPPASLSYEVSYNHLEELKAGAEQYLASEYVSFNYRASVSAEVVIPSEYTREFAVAWLKSENKESLSVEYTITDTDGNSLKGSLPIRFKDDVLPELYKNNTRVSSISLGGGTDFEPASREVLTKYCKELIEKSGDTYQVIDEIDGEIDFKFGFEYDEGHEYEASLIAEDKSGNVIKAYDASTKISSEKVEEHIITYGEKQKRSFTFMRDHIRYFFEGDNLFLSTPDYDYFTENYNIKNLVLNMDYISTNDGNPLSAKTLVSGMNCNIYIYKPHTNYQSIVINFSSDVSHFYFIGNLEWGYVGVFFYSNTTLEFIDPHRNYQTAPTMFYFESENPLIINCPRDLDMGKGVKPFEQK